MTDKPPSPERDIPTSVISSADWEQVQVNQRFYAAERLRTGRKFVEVPNTQFRFVVSDDSAP